MSFSYATPTSGPSAGGIGWVNFGTFTLVNGAPATSFSGTLNDGSTVTFDISLAPVSGVPRNFAAVTVPTFPGSNFGVSGYTLIPGNVALNSVLITPGGVNTVNITNIVVTDINNNPVTNYTAVVADSERTNLGEIWTWNTNGGNWVELAELGNAVSPTLTGLGTQTANIIGVNLVETNAYVLTTQTPTSLALTLTSGILSREAFSLGFAVTKVNLQKNIAGRADPSDQFVLNIGGTPSANATTTGTSSGLQLPIASVFATPGATYSISEAMAGGSASPLTAYTQVVSASNATPAGSVPLTGNLPINFTPVLGDDVTYTILNIAPEEFTKTVDKAYADLGDELTYSITIENNNNFAVANVVVNDPTPLGTTFVAGSLVVVGSAFTGTDPNSGVTLTSIPANTVATLTWKVKVNSLPPISNPVTNVAMVDVPGGTSGPTNAVTTQVNTAYVTVNKVTDRAFANAGDVITYTLLLNNAGNVAADNVILTDAIPSGTTFVPGSVIGATGTPPTLSVASIPAGGNATVSFKVTVNNALPVPNPIPNSASVNYNYTVDPAQPNGATGTRASNTVTTQANMALVSTTKTVDVVYAETEQILTYTLFIKNSGNVAANNVIITDNIPAGTTFVAGSVTGAIGTPPNLALPAPLSAGATAVVMFKVKVDSSIPTTNPIINTADVDFVYTVDPNIPNGGSGTSASNAVSTQVNDANIDTVLAVDKVVTDVGTVLTYTITLTNNGNVPANNVTINAPDPSGTTFINGSLMGATGTTPALSLLAPIPAGGSTTVTYQVLVDNTIPSPNPIPQTVTTNYNFTLDPANPNGQTGVSTSNTVNTLVNSAIIEATKAADLAYANVGDIITYTITVTNSGNVTANNAIITDALPAGVSFVAGSLTGATGTPPTLTLIAPIAAGGSAVVTYKVLVNAVVPSSNPVENSASVAFTYTVDSSKPNAASSVSFTNTVETQINTAKLAVSKSVDKAVSYIGDVITYQLAVTNTGNVNANNAVITDLIPVGTMLVPGSMLVSAPYTLIPNIAISISGPIVPDQTVAITFKVMVTDIPNPNPIVNIANAEYSYTVDPLNPNGVVATTASNAVTTTVFRNNYAQQISDLIDSVAFEQAALAAIANAEGAKIQRIAAMPGVTQNDLLCLNKSVADMISSISLLEAILKQKLSIVDCQITGETC